jgi:hypothetical protein
MGEIVFRHHIFQGPNRGREADAGGLAEFAGHPLEGGAQEIPLVAVPDLDLGQGQEVPAHIGPVGENIFLKNVL